jgi:serine/threonine protein kinase
MQLRYFDLGLRRNTVIARQQNDIDDSQNYKPSESSTDLVEVVPLRSNDSVLPDIRSEDYIDDMMFLCNGSHSNIFTGNFSGASPSVIELCEDISSPGACLPSKQTSTVKVPVVIKVMKETSISNENATREFVREKNYLRRVQHKNIVVLFAAGKHVLGQNAQFLVLERLNGGTLSSIISGKRPFHSRPFTLPALLVAACEFSSALKYLHSEISDKVAFAHRDLKPDNIGFTAAGTLKLMDFGLCVAIPKSGNIDDTYTMTGCTGSLRYMAKECAIGAKYNEKVDIYSFGLILYEMATGVTPFKGFNKEKFMKNVVQGSERPSLDLDEYGRKIKVSPEIVDVIKRCWDTDYSSRPCAKEVHSILLKEKEKVILASKTFFGSIANALFGRSY